MDVKKLTYGTIHYLFSLEVLTAIDRHVSPRLRPHDLSPILLNLEDSVMEHTHYLSRVENLMNSSGNVLLNMDYETAEGIVRSGDPTAIRSIEGQFAIAAVDGRKVRMARSIGRPMRYFLAKQVDGPC